MPGYIFDPNNYDDDSLFAAPKPAVDRNTVVTGTHRNSHVAAANALPRSGSQRRRIYDLVAETVGGLTADDIQRLTNLPTNSVNPRVHELAKDGLLIDSGRRRDTRWGSPATVWVVAA